MKLLTQIEQETTSQRFIDELATAALDVTERPSQTALVERSAPDGAMPPLHRRDEAETYRVLEGEVLFFIDDEVVLARYRGVGRGSGVEVDVEGAHVWKLREGKAVRLEVFASRERALCESGM